MRKFHSRLGLLLILCATFWLASAEPARGAEHQNSDSVKIPTAFRDGVKYFAHQSYKEAYKAFALFLKEHPRHLFSARARYLLAESNDHVQQNGSGKAKLQVAKQYQQALQLSPDSPRAVVTLMRVADLFFEQSFFVEAKDSWLELVERFPQDEGVPQFLLKLGKLTLKEESYEESKTFFETLIRKHPKHRLVGMAHLQLGMVRFKLEQYGRAIKMFEKGARLAPQDLKQDADILQSFGETQYLLRRYKQARETFLVYTKLYPKNPNSANLMVRTADTYLQEKRFNSALRLYIRTIELFPQHEISNVARLRLADLGIRQPELSISSKGASKYFHAPLQTYRDVASENEGAPLAELALLKEGLALRQMGRHDEALQPLRKVVLDHPDGKLKVNAQDAIKIVVEEIIEQEFKAKKFLEVLQTHYANSRFAKRSRLNYPTQFRIGRSLQKLKFLQPALDAYQDLYLQPDHANMAEDLIWRIFEIFQQQGDLERASALMERFQVKFPSSPHLTLLSHLMADIKYGQQNWLEAASLYRKALKRTSSPWRRSLSLYRLGKALTASDRYHEVSVVFQRLLKVRTKNDQTRRLLIPILDDARFALANAWFALRRFDKALVSYHLFIHRRRQEPAASFSLYHVGRILDELHRLHKQRRYSVNSKRALKALETRNDALWPLLAEYEQSSQDWETNLSRTLQNLRRHNFDQNG